MIEKSEETTAAMQALLDDAELGQALRVVVAALQADDEELIIEPWEPPGVVMVRILTRDGFDGGKYRETIETVQLARLLSQAGVLRQ